MKNFHCDHCKQLVFFENTICQHCGSTLGFIAEHQAISSFQPAGNDQWRSLMPIVQGKLYRQCQNYALEHVCNWMVPADDANPLCQSCRFTQMIPSLGNPANRSRWFKLEAAKRRLIYTLQGLGLPLQARDADHPNGLAFHFGEDAPDGTRFTTGHDNGVIAVNVIEADDAERERMRTAMHEPYRTLLGHFRHEIGHYYWDLLIQNSNQLDAFRSQFGDEREDYAQALQRHYHQGPPADWQNRSVSAYATSHPWEDWAETWAHYLHIVDTSDTASACGFALTPRDPSDPSISVEQAILKPNSFDDLIARWFPLTYALNSLNRSLGQADSYPFVLAPTVIDKLRFVHHVIAQSSQAAPAQQRIAA